MKLLSVTEVVGLLIRFNGGIELLAWNTEHEEDEDGEPVQTVKPVIRYIRNVVYPSDKPYFDGVDYWEKVSLVERNPLSVDDYVRLVNKGVEKFAFKSERNHSEYRLVHFLAISVCHADKERPFRLELEGAICHTKNVFDIPYWMK